MLLQNASLSQTNSVCRYYWAHLSLWSVWALYPMLSSNGRKFGYWAQLHTSRKSFWPTSMLLRTSILHHTTHNKDAKELTPTVGNTDILLTMDWWLWKSVSCNIDQVVYMSIHSDGVLSLPSSFLLFSIFPFVSTYPRFCAILWLHWLYPSQNRLFDSRKL